MAAYPRRFRVWPRENLIGAPRNSAYAEGVQFTDGTVVVRFMNAIPTSIVYPEQGMDALLRGVGFGGPSEIEWLDGLHG